ncbi:hypothetical protein [Alkalicoccus urumqiensis]|nr:hypothetical protein [Alkalicoccus urumqiensis]
MRQTCSEVRLHRSFGFLASVCAGTHTAAAAGRKRFYFTLRDKAAAVFLGKADEYAVLPMSDILGGRTNPA